MILAPRPVGPHRWAHRMFLGLIPGIVAGLIVGVGGHLVVLRDRADLAVLQDQVRALPNVAERADASSILTSATTAVNAAISTHNSAVASVNLLDRLVSQLPAPDVRVVSYMPDQASVTVEAASQDELGTYASALVRKDILDVSNPSNTLGSKTLYPTATLGWTGESSTPAPHRAAMGPAPAGSQAP